MPDEPEDLSPDADSPTDPMLASAGNLTGDTWRRDETAPSGGDETIVTGHAAAPAREIIGDFEILGKLGQGGMGTVYRARQISLDRVVALKLLPGNLEADAEFVTRFQREARVAASLSHGNLVKVYASGAIDGTHFIAMELIEGETLGDAIRRGALPPPEALRICGDVARALEHGWQRAHLIHRDIKPGNIFLSASGEVKVGDLGLAKTIGGDTTGLTQTGTAMGTPHYISPEQARGDRDLDFRADIYSLGCTLYQMLTGRTPYSGTNPMTVMSMHINAPPPAILKVLPQCPIPLARLVSKTLKKSKHERPGSYGEFIAEIERLRALLTPTEDPLEATLPPERNPAPVPTPRSATPVTAPVRTTSKTLAPKRSKVILFGSLAAGIIVLGVLAAVFWPKAKPRDKSTAQSTPAPSTPGAGLSAVAPAKATAEPWHDVLRDPAMLELRGDVARTTDGLRFTGGGEAKLPRGRGPKRHGAIRIRATYGGVPPQLRVRWSGVGLYQLYANTGKTLILNRLDEKLRQWTSLGEFKPPGPLRIGEDYTLELRVVGSTLTAKLNEQTLGSVTDEAMAEGQFAVVTSTKSAVDSTLIKSLEILDLEASAATSGPAAAEPWQDVQRDLTSIQLFGAVEKTSQGLRFNDGCSAVFLPGKGPQRDGAVRMRLAFGHGDPQLSIHRTEDGSSYGLRIKNNFAELIRWDGPAKQGATLGNFALPRPLQVGEDYTLELRIVGSSLSARFNGQTLGTATDAKYPAGRSQVSVGTATAPVLLKSFEVLDLEKSDISNAASPNTTTAESWQDVLRDPTLAVSGAAKLAPEGLVLSGVGRAYIRVNATPPDGAVRLRAVYGDGCRPELRARMDPEIGSYQLVAYKEQSIHLSRLHKGAAQSTPLRVFPLREVLRAGQEFEMELRVTGATLTAKLNGEVLGTVQDATFARGHFAVACNDSDRPPTLIKTLEVLDLDAPGRASVPPADSSQLSSAEPWQDMLREPGALSLYSGAELTAQGLFLPDKASATVKPTGPDGALRIRATNQTKSLTLRARAGEHATINYSAIFGGPPTARLLRMAGTTPTILREFPLTRPPAAGADYEFEMRAVGSTFSLSVDGTALGEVRDEALVNGNFSVANFTGSPVRVKACHFLRLPPAGTKASSATKDTPFVNTLGMKFVPVPITGGPTSGQRVLFSIWETRVQDYLPFTKEQPPAKWSLATTVPQEGPHPIVMASAEDAERFCAWLTDRERRAGSLAAGLAYRLPSDHEWSCAVGIGEREDASSFPMRKSGRIETFPWGETWPPPPGAGNYSGEEANDGRMWAKQGILAKYRDLFPKLAPVGSFAANRLGLFDLGGNVYEWCADPAAAGTKQRALRGGAFAFSDRAAALSSHRRPDGADYRGYFHGFRVVLAPAP